MEPGQYTRTVLRQDRDFEVVSIVWAPGSSSKKHDHGQAWGLGGILEGRVYEEKDEVRVYYEAGSVLIEGPSTIHLLGNDGEKPAKTLHYYTPRLVMNFHE